MFPNGFVIHDLVIVDYITGWLFQKRTTLISIYIHHFFSHQRLLYENLVACQTSLYLFNYQKGIIYRSLQVYILLWDWWFEIVRKSEFWLLWVRNNWLFEGCSTRSHYISRRLQRLFELYYIFIGRFCLLNWLCLRLVKSFQIYFLFRCDQV